jgi:hypothetical protein
MISLANNSNSLKTELEIKISQDVFNFLSLKNCWQGHVCEFILQNLVKGWQHVLAGVDSLVYPLCNGEGCSVPNPNV